MTGGILFCLIPVTMQAQLITLNYMDGCEYNLWKVPHHADDFFDYASCKMYDPGESEYVSGRSWDVARFAGSRKPIEAYITGVFGEKNATGPTRSDTIHIRYDGQGKLIDYVSTGEFPRVEAHFVYDADGCLKQVEGNRGAFGTRSFRVDACCIERRQSTLEGRPYELKTDVGFMTYKFDDNLRVIQADFHFVRDVNRGYDYVFRTGEPYGSRSITFFYTYDDAGNIIRIDVNRHMEDDKAKNVGSTRMRYDTQNRLIEQEMTDPTHDHVRKVYTYADDGQLTGVDEYEYDPGMTQPSCLYRYRYIIKRDAQGRAVNLSQRATSHLYGPEGSKDLDNGRYKGGGVQTVYTYDKYGNWVTMKLYIDGQQSAQPCSFVIRDLHYSK